MVACLREAAYCFVTDTNFKNVDPNRNTLLKTNAVARGHPSPFGEGKGMRQDARTQKDNKHARE